MGSPDSNLFIARPCIPLVLALIVGLIVGSSLTPPYPWSLPYWVILLLTVFPLAILFFPSLSLWAGCYFFLLTGLL